MATEFELEIEDFVFTVDFVPGVPARTWGPPEDCYPGDPPELEITQVGRYDDGDTAAVVSAPCSSTTATPSRPPWTKRSTRSAPIPKTSTTSSPPSLASTPKTTTPIATEETDRGRERGERLVGRLQRGARQAAKAGGPHTQMGRTRTDRQRA